MLGDRDGRDPAGRRKRAKSAHQGQLPAERGLTPTSTPRSWAMANGLGALPQKKKGNAGCVEKSEEKQCRTRKSPEQKRRKEDEHTQFKVEGKDGRSRGRHDTCKIMGS